MTSGRADSNEAGARALRLAEASLDASREPLFRVGAGGRISYVNDSACRTLGYSRDELLALTVSDIDPEFPPEKFAAAWEALCETGALEVEGRQRRKDGSVFPVLLNINLMELDGEALAFVSARDLTAQKEAQEAEAQIQQRSRLARNFSGIGWFEWSSDKDEFVWDDETFRIFGYEPGSVTPNLELFMQHVIPEDHHLIRDATHRFHHEKDTGFENEYRIETAAGERRHVREEVVVTRSEDDAIIYATGNIRDVTEAKQALAELHESEERLNAAQRLARMGEWYLDLVEERLTYSDQVYEILGVSKDTYEPSRDRYEAIVHPDDKEKFRGEVRDKTYAGEAVGHDHRIIRPDGRVIHVEQHNEPIFDAAGKIIARRGTIQDITGRKEIEARLHEAQRMGRMGEWYYDLGDDRLTYSAQVYDILGVPRESYEPSRDHYDAFVHPDDKEKLRGELRDKTHAGETVVHDHRIIRPDGQTIHVQQHNEPIFDAAGKIIARRGTIQDITESKLATLALQESEARLREAQRIARMGEWYLDMVNEKLTYSAQVYDLLGVSPETFEPSPNHFEGLVHPDDREWFRTDVKDRVYEPETLNYDHRLVRADGQVLYVEQRNEPVLDDAGKVIARRGTIQDITESKLATLALQESEKRLREAQRIAHMGEWYRDLVTHELTYSDEIYELLGVTRENFTPSPEALLALIHPDDRDFFQHIAHKKILEPVPFTYSHRIVRPDGEIIHVEQRSEPVLGEDGKVMARRGTIQDISPLKEATLALQKNEAEFAQAQAIAHIGSWYRDLMADELTYSDEMFQILGVRKEEYNVVPESFMELVHPDDRDHVHNISQSDPEAPRMFNYEHRIVRPDGTVRYIDHHSAPVFDEAGNVIARRGTMQDITARKETEIALELAQHSLDASHDLIFRCAKDGRILYANPAACRSLGYSKEELLKLSVPDMNPYIPPDILREQWRELRTTGVLQLESRHLRKDGSTYPVTATVSYVKHGGKEYSYVSARDITVEKEAERKLLELGERFSHARQDAGFGTWEWEAASGKITWSDETFAIVGLEVGSPEPSDPEYTKMVHPEDRERYLNMLAESHKHGGEFDSEYRLVRPDGSIRYIEEHGVATEGADGQVLYVTGTVQDITNEKLAELHLERVEQRFALARRNARMGTWEWGIETGSAKWSDETFLIYGYEPGLFQPTYKNFENLVHPEDKDALHAAEREAFESGADLYEADFRIVMADGEVKHVHDSGVISRDESGKANYMTGIVQDISERKRAEQAIADSERHYRSLFESSLDGIMIADDEGRIKDANPAILAMLGYDIETLRSKNVDEITPPEWREMTQEMRVQVQRRPQDEYEKEYFRADGTRVSVTVHVWPISGEGGRIMAIIRDITESRRIEEQLRQAQKMEAVGQLTGGIAHDFNNLLTVVMGNLEIVADDLTPESDASDKVSRAYRAAGRGANLTHQLLAFSRKQTLSPIRIDPDQLITEMSDMLRISLDEAVELSIRSNGNLWLCRADKAQLENTILNLAINARDAMPSGGTLTIKTENAVLDDVYVASHEDARPGEYIMFTVSDTGCGIPPDILDHVFEPFFTTKDVGAGSGLGLSMIYGFAKQFGGHVTIESEVGKGTVVKHYLPRWVPDA